MKKEIYGKSNNMCEQNLQLKQKKQELNSNLLQIN
ncbi:unnamed protein product [Paramecium octaurelia]|uniref:Uncharacterized protein n=1 Tax=Paramecium octaurelia TaxID=43137 RepID=A0A8S1SC87_PAROT|nr:unnamed protein product [Paramecium octaurelia]